MLILGFRLSINSEGVIMRRVRKMNIGWVLIAIGCIGLVTSAICLPIGINMLTKPKPFMQGTIGAFEIDTSKEFTVNCGSNFYITDYRSLKNGIDLKRLINVKGFEYPIQIRSIDGKLSISAWINDAKGNMSAHIVDNNWEVNPDNFFDRNFSNYAVEVVDKDLVPVLQVEIKSGNYVYIGGLFYYESGKILVTPRGYFPDPSEEMFNEEVETLFVYPSDKHLGQRKS
jgi:hypothetical protein